jgi:hypothetical protein
MTTDDIIEYIQNITWEDVKDLPHVNGRVYLNEDLETQDRELENSNFLYLTLCSEPREDDKDRYFGSNTDSTIKSFMDRDYLGSPAKNKDIFEKSLSEYEHRNICLKIGNMESKILIEEEDVLEGVDAKNNVKFFNASNISGGIQKTLGNQTTLFDEITKSIENTNKGEDSNFRTDKEDIHTLYKMKRAQPRSTDLDDTHVNNIEKDVLGTKGKVLKTIRNTILLENYYGLGIHKRGGNTHTLEACMKKSLENYLCKIGVVFWSESSWNKCSENTIRDILLWDNKKRLAISTKNTNLDEIINSCQDFIKDYKLKSHTDERVKDRARALGCLESEWKATVREKLKDWFNKKETESLVPSNMELIIYKDGDISKHEEEAKTPTHDLKILTTVQAGGGFTGWDYIIGWLTDKDNKQKTLHIDFMHGKNSIEKYAEAWVDRENDIKKKIRKLFEVFGKEGHVTFDVMKRTQPKQNKIHG